MCNTLNIKVLELYCNIKKWNIELDTLSNSESYGTDWISLSYSQGHICNG